MYKCASSPSFGFAPADKFCPRVSKLLLDIGTRQSSWDLSSSSFQSPGVGWKTQNDYEKVEFWDPNHAKIPPSKNHAKLRFPKVICVRHTAILISTPWLITTRVCVGKISVFVAFLVERPQFPLRMYSGLFVGQFSCVEIQVLRCF
jgi:hypothetical protein